MNPDPGLKHFESSQDVVRHDWSVEQRGDDVVTNVVLAKFHFTISHPVARVWKYFKDFNLWMEDLKFNEIVGDQPEGSTISLTISEAYYEHYKEHYGLDPRTLEKQFTVKRVIPEKLFVKESLSKDGKAIASYYVYTLHEVGSKTIISGLMSYPPNWLSKTSEQEVRTTSESRLNEIEKRWKKSYIPRLRQVVEENR